MAYVQVRKFDQTKAGKVSGFCLRNVRLGYGISNKYLTATIAWQHTQQHKNRTIPKGVDVPLFYSWKTPGHINVRLASGKVWNDGRIFSSLSTFEASMPSAKYLGWGESVNDVKVIKEDEVTSKTTAIWLNRTLNHKHSPSDASIKAWTGLNDKQLATKLENVYGSAWFKAQTAAINGSTDSKFKVLADKVKALIPFTN